MQNQTEISFRDIAVLALAIGVIFILQGRIDSLTDGAEEAKKELLYLPHPKVFHILALNDDLLAADLLWLKTVFYIAANNLEEKQEEYQSDLNTKAARGLAGRKPVDFASTDFRADRRLRSMLFWNLNSDDLPELQKLVDTVTDLDPRFITPYIHGAMNLAMFAGRFDEAMMLLDKAVANRPDRWEPYYYRGFLKLFYANDKSGAAEDVRLAGLNKEAPVIVVQLAAALQIGTGQKDAAIEFLRSLRQVTDDVVLAKKIDDMLVVYESGAKIIRKSKESRIGEMLDSLSGNKN